MAAGSAALEIALGYVARGWHPIPIPGRQKRPAIENWNKLRITTESAHRYFNGSSTNIGVLLGEPSGNLVDADLDCPEALTLASSFLPPTESVFGRAGKPKSHWLYLSALPKRIAFEDPEGGDMLLELRSTGGQTVFPGSTHESGETVEWHEDSDPAEVDPDQLTRAGSRLAAACVLARAAPAEDRHNYLVLITGFLVRTLGHDGAAAILAPVARLVLGKRYNKPDGHRLLDDTARKIEAGDPVPGWPKLVETIGEKRAARLAAWLGVERREKTSPVEWPDPAALPGGLPPVKAFDMIMLPEALQPWVADISERMQVPADFPAVGAMILAGSIVGRKVRIRPKERDDWTVTPNLWGGIVGRPGLMKTPALQEICRALVGLEIAAKKEHEQALAEYEAMQRIAKQRKKIDDEKITKDLKAKRDPKGIAQEIVATTQAEPPPHRARYVVNDTSVEKLGEILAANPNGVLLFRDELIGFLRSMDRDGREGDRSFYLEAWNGNGRFTYDRIGRGTVDIESCCVSLLGGIQPGPLSGYLESMARGGAGDDGLMQRLQLLVWPDIGKEWRNVDRTPNKNARDLAEKFYQNIETNAPLAATETDGDVAFVRFDAEAQRAFDHWRAGLESRLRSDALHPAMESHLAKYRSLVPSLALLCHLADVGKGSVGIVALERALAWAEYLETHAARIYDSVIRADLHAAHALGQHILAGDLASPFALRDVYRPCWTGLSTRDSAAAAVAVLCDLEWLLPEGRDAPQGRGRPAERYVVNPKIKIETPK